MIDQLLGWELEAQPVLVDGACGNHSELREALAALLQLGGHPTQFPSAAMVDWETGQPNAPYWVVKLIRQHFGPGDKLVDGRVLTPPQPALLPAYVYAQGFVNLQGKRKILLINNRDRAFEVSLPGAAGAQVEVVDQTTGSRPPEASTLPRDELILKGLAVAVVTLPEQARNGSAAEAKNEGALCQ